MGSSARELIFPQYPLNRLKKFLPYVLRMVRIEPAPGAASGTIQGSHEQKEHADADLVARACRVVKLVLKGAPLATFP
jgi:hypothetical protein